jgi:hypothetical protein
MQFIGQARPPARRRSGTLTWALRLSLVFVIGARSAHAQTQVIIDTSNVIAAGFVGFGAQWDAAGYTENGVTEQDYQVIEKRIRWMHLPVVRTMMLTRWALVADGVFDFETHEMRQLYRQLDVCQREGIIVFLTDWGCERYWTAAPGIQDTADPKYAKAIGTYLDHLINKKGYTNIKYFILVNEPNFEASDFEHWQVGLQNVRVELASRGLDRAVTLAGPDHSYAESWLYRSVDQLAGVLGAYDVHRYADGTSVRSGGLESYFLDQWDYARTKDANAAKKPLVVGEAGMSDGVNPVAGGNENINDFLYGLWMADYGIQAARAGSHAILAWMLDDNSFTPSDWGMWSNHRAGMVLRPWFYTWSLFTRYVPPGSTIYRPPQSSRDLRILASRSPLGEWTFCVVNRGDSAAHLLLRAPDSLARAFRVYEYSRVSSVRDADGFPVPIDAMTAAPETGVDVSVPREAVIVVTSVQVAQAVVPRPRSPDPLGPDGSVRDLGRPAPARVRRDLTSAYPSRQRRLVTSLRNLPRAEPTHAGGGR